MREESQRISTKNGIDSIFFFGIYIIHMFDLSCDSIELQLLYTFIACIQDIQCHPM